MLMPTLLLGLTLVWNSWPALAEEVVPRFEDRACSFADEEWAAGEVIDCGDLIVRENRRLEPGHPYHGRTLRLPVAILRSTSDDPEPDPYLFIQGGPGVPTVKWVKGTVGDAHTRRIRERRDYVLLDLRGTGDAPDPCAEVGLGMLRIYGADLSADEHLARSTELLVGCAERAGEAGHDWTAYSAAQAAADIGDLMALLPYEQWNLFGVSYGTRIALVAMRDAPEMIRSVVLDSPLPIRGQDFVDSVPHFAAALERLYAMCAADGACSQAYPELEADLHEAVARLEAEPMRVPMGDRERFPDGTFTVNAADMSYALYRSLSRHTFLPLYPLLVQEAKAGNVTVMAAMVEALSGGSTDGTFNQSTYQGMLCYDEASFASREAYERSARPYPATLHGVGYEMAHCDAWPAPSAAPQELEPVVSSIPTMILHGEFDHQTPPVFGEDLVGRLDHSAMFVYPGRGHYPSAVDDCAQSMIADFVEDPAKDPDVSCMDDIPALEFVTDVYITGGIYRVLTGVLSPPRALPLVSIGLVLFVQLSAVAVWPLAALRRRLLDLERTGHPSARPSRRELRLAWVMAFLGVGFVAGLVWTIVHVASTMPPLLAFGVPGKARLLFVAPFVVGVLSLSGLKVAVREWRWCEWPRLWRWHYTAVALAGAGFAVLTIYWGLI